MVGVSKIITIRMKDEDKDVAGAMMNRRTRRMRWLA